MPIVGEEKSRLPFDRSWQASIVASVFFPLSSLFNEGKYLPPRTGTPILGFGDLF
jgi:hypothetical protein